MKFVVTKNQYYSNEVNVTLHYETKEKIRKILQTLTAVAAVGGVLAYSQHAENKKTKAPSQ